MILLFLIDSIFLIDSTFCMYGVFIGIPGRIRKMKTKCDFWRNHEFSKFDRFSNIKRICSTQGNFDVYFLWLIHCKKLECSKFIVAHSQKMRFFVGRVDFCRGYLNFEKIDKSYTFERWKRLCFIFISNQIKKTEFA